MKRLMTAILAAMLAAAASGQRAAYLDKAEQASMTLARTAAGKYGMGKKAEKPARARRHGAQPAVDEQAQLIYQDIYELTVQTSRFLNGENATNVTLKSKGNDEKFKDDKKLKCLRKERDRMKAKLDKRLAK